MQFVISCDSAIAKKYWTWAEVPPSVRAITTIPVVGGANDTYPNHHPSRND
jgi:hypothetical protein